jgi:hypothetical protein
MLHSFIVYDNLYTKEECKQIIDTANQMRSTLYVDKPGAGKKVDTFLVETGSFLQRVNMGKFMSAVRNANRDVWNYDLYDPIPQTLNINVYSNDKNEYPYHKDACDFGSFRDIKLTAILNLSQDSYEGGEFQIFDKTDSTIDFGTGSLLIFPSYYFHRVTPVTSGERITLSCWYDGPNFR